MLAARDGHETQSKEALEKLCRTYWRPLYTFIRRNGYNLEDAQDLTQEFFSRLVSREYLRRLQDQRGKFRSFLLTFVKHFLSDERDKAEAQKRGGGKTFVSLDETYAEENQLLEGADQLNPDQHFERRWAETLLQAALQRLQEEYVAGGKAALFDRLKDLQPGERGALSYAQVAEELGMSEAAIKSAAHRLRQRHRELVRQEIAQTVTDPGEIDEEIRYLLAVLSR